MKNTKELVQEIHDSFNSASDVQLLESQERIENLKKDIKPVENEKVGRRMMKLGFTGTNISRKVRQSDHNNRETKNRIINLEKQAELVVEKYQLDPVHKFITENKVMEICEKYNLLHGPARCYIGEIPMRNLGEIEKFKLSESEVIVEARLDESQIEKVKKMNKLIWENMRSVGSSWVEPIRMPNQKEKIKTDLRTLKEVVTKGFTYETNNYDFSICAPSKDFDMTDMEIKGRKIMKKEIPDPVVLCKVDGGYRIVTAWGLEASDPGVMNPINN